MRILLLLIASLPLFGQTTVNTPAQTLPVTDITCYTLTSNPPQSTCGTAISAAQAPKGTVKVLIKGVPVKLKLAEANQLLVDLAKKINAVSANSAMTTEGEKRD